jgi:hypothetical protein
MLQDTLLTPVLQSHDYSRFGEHNDDDSPDS